MAQKFYNDELIISKGSNNFEFDLIHSYKDILSNSKVKRVHSNTLLSDATITPNLYEPLNTFTEVDSSGHINLSATTCTITSCPDDATCYAYKNYGASYFADFKHNFEINSANSFDHGPGLWGVSNNIGEYNGWSSGLAVTLAAGAGGFYHGLSLFDKSTGKISTLGGNWEFHINNTYYATVERRGATVTLKVYSDAARTSQLGPTATLTATDTTSYRYLYCFDTRGNYNYGTMSGFSQNFSIHLGIQQSIASDSIVKQENIQKTLYSNSKVILRSSQDIYSDSKVKYVFQKPLTSSSIIKIIDIQKEILSDTKVVSRNLENITSDSNILQIRQQNITSDASVTHTRTQDILSGSKIVTREQNGVLSDTIVKIVYQKDISSDSKIKQIEIPQDVLSDSLIHHQYQEELSSDSKIKKLGITQEVLTDTKIKQLGVQHTTLSDADIIYQVNQYITSDTKVKKIGVQQTVLDDSKVVRRYQQTITSDAYIRYSKDFYGRLRAEVITDKDFYAQLKVDQPTPLEPTGGQAFDMYTGEGVKLTWTDTGNYGYNVYLMVSGSWVKQNQSIIKTTEYIVGNLTTGVTYEFKITGVNGQGEESS